MTDAKPTIRRPRRRARRALYGVLALVVLAAGAHGLAWRWATGALAVGMSDWVTQRRAEGWTVVHGPPTRGGWPFAARLTMADLRIEAPARAGQAAIAHQAARVVLQLALPRPDRLHILLDGPQRLRLGDAVIPFAAERFAFVLQIATDPSPPMITFDTTRFEALLPEGPVLVRAARVVLVPAAPGGPGAGARGGAGLRAAEAEAALAISVQAEGVVPPASPLTLAFGREIESVSLDALLAGPWPFPGPPAVAAAGWRDGGGVLDIPALALRWGPLAGDARLSVALDGALQPQGQGTLRVSGAPEALDALARAGLIDGNAARTAQGIAALLARRPPEGGAPRVELPVALANGTLSLARVPLLRVAPIAWPGSRSW